MRNVALYLALKDVPSVPPAAAARIQNGRELGRRTVRRAAAGGVYFRMVIANERKKEFHTIRFFLIFPLGIPIMPTRFGQSNFSCYVSAFLSYAKKTSPIGRRKIRFKFIASHPRCGCSGRRGWPPTYADPAPRICIFIRVSSTTLFANSF